MEKTLNSLQNNPFTLVLIAVVALSIALLIVFPALLSYIKSIHIPFPEPQTTKKSDEQVFDIKPKKNLPKQKLNLKIQSLVAAAALAGVVILLGAGYVAYDFFYRPVRIINAWQLKLEQGGKLSKLQKGGLSVWMDEKIYILDVRSHESYAKDHIAGSASLPANRAASEFYPIEGITVIVYSSEFNTDEARKVAEGILKNGKSEKIKIKNPGKIFVIKDGFEGLKEAGLKTEEGTWD